LTTARPSAARPVAGSPDRSNLISGEQPTGPRLILRYAATGVLRTVPSAELTPERLVDELCALGPSARRR
jgi:hypothetical protein